MTREDEIFKKLEYGDENGVAELIELYYDEILHYCQFYLQDDFIAQDAAQETFLKIFRYFNSYRHKGKFRAFLYKVAANTCIDMRKKKRWGSIVEEVAQEDASIKQTEEQEDFLRIIRKLPPELEEIVFLRFSQELKLREISEITGLPLRTVQSRLRRALSLLGKILDFSGGEKI